jgi:integrase/recombinase XerD
MIPLQPIRYFQTSRSYVTIQNSVRCSVPIAGKTLPEPDWHGLSDLEVRRLKAGAEQLIHLQTRSNQRPLRNYAILMVMLDSGLRVEIELAELQLEQFRRRALHSIHRKGDLITGKIPLSSDTCDALRAYIDRERPAGPGALFQTKNGNPLVQQDVDYVLDSIAGQANARLAEKDHIELSPHVLRHTALRKWTEKKGVRFAQKIAGHASERYIWRYVTPSEDEVQAAVDELWELSEDRKPYDNTIRSEVSSSIQCATVRVR